jgi:membrane-associated phospholipid phosphatase
MQRWEAWVRASVLDFELVSALGFHQGTGGVMTVRHLDTTGFPNATYQDLMAITRPSESQFKDWLVFMDRYADLRPDRAAEIMTQLNGGLTFLCSVPFLHPARTPWTLELLAAALRLANYTEMRFKQALSCRRPNEYSPQVQPIILTPSHGSFPSGHATETFISAYVLWKLLQASPTTPYGDQSWGEQLFRLANRVAVNRTVAGVHFPIDSAAGAVLGLTLGRYFVARCARDPEAPPAVPLQTYIPFAFDGTQFPSTTTVGSQTDGDFYWTLYYDVPTDTQLTQLLPNPYVTNSTAVTVQSSPLLYWLWDKARAEWN